MMLQAVDCPFPPLPVPYYGCFCGINGSKEPQRNPIDKFDSLCKAHDDVSTEQFLLDFSLSNWWSLI